MPTCAICSNPPYCSVVSGARSILGAWARERRRQLGEAASDMGAGLPDRAAMDDAVAAALPTIPQCACACHVQCSPDRVEEG